MIEIELNKNIDINKALNEPNFKMFKYNGHLCVIYRVSHGHYCGYVGVNKKSSCYGINYYTSEDDFSTGNDNKIIISNEEKGINNLSVHGGLTFANDSLSCFDNIFGNEIWWFGFDTAHAGDASLYTHYRSHFDSDVYRDFEYVKSEVTKLSDQIKQIENE